MSVPVPPVMRLNFRLLYADVLWYGVLAGSTVAFLAIYATRLGASSFQISLLAAGPGLVNLLISLPAGQWLESRPLIQASFRSSVWHRLGYLALVPLPWLVDSATEIWAILLITLLMSVPGTLLAVAFNATLADVVPPDWRAEVVGRRNALLSLSMTTTSLISGQMLDFIVFPLNFQIVFALGAVGALLSSYQLKQLRQVGDTAPPRVGKPMFDLARPGVLRFIDTVRYYPGLRFFTRMSARPMLRMDLLHGSFGKFLVAYYFFYTFQYVGLPVFPLYFVRVLDLSNVAISLGTALFHLLTMLVSLRLSSLSSRFGHRRLLVAGGLLFGQYPLLLALANDATLFWVASFVGGIVWAVLNGGLINRLMERVPDEDRPAHMTLHNMVLNLGILTGSLGGPLLIEWLGLHPSLFVSAGLRLLGGILLVLWG